MTTRFDSEDLAAATVTPPPSPESTWELYDRIEPCAIIYGTGRRMFCQEFNSSRRLLKQLWRIGRGRLRIRGAVTRNGAVPHSHLAAWNCYLEHQFSAQSLNSLRAGKLHRFTWYAMQEAVPLVWVR